MIRVRIGNAVKELSESSPQWINEQINKMRADGILVCVQVMFDLYPLQFTLSTQGCSQGVGGGRPLNQQELGVLAIWEKLHLSKPDFASGNLVAFLRQVS